MRELFHDGSLGRVSAPLGKRVFDRLMSNPGHGYLVWGLALCVGVLAIAAVQLCTGAPVLTQIPWDVPLFLDGAWRILNGQVPHLDFSLPTGAFTFYVVALGMIWRGTAAVGIVAGNVLLAGIVAMLGFTVLRKRTTPFLAFFVALMWAVLTCAPRPIGEPYRSLSYAMLYNRHGEAFIGILFVLLFVSRLDRSTAGNRVCDGLLIGVIASILLLTKVNYGLLAVAAVLMGLILGTTGRRTVIAGILSAVLFLGAVVLMTGMTPDALCSDYIARVIQQSGGGRGRQFVLGVMNQWWLIPLFICLSAAADDLREGWWQRQGVVCFIFLSFWALLATDCQFDESPLLIVLALRLSEQVRRKEPSCAATGAAACKPWLFASAVVLIGCRTLHPDLVSVGYAATKRLTYRDNPVLQGTALRDFRLDEATQWLYRQQLSDGVSLVRQCADEGEGMKLWVGDCTDPYTFAFGWPPLKGGDVWSCGDASGAQEYVIPSTASHWLVLRSSMERTNVQHVVSTRGAVVIGTNQSYALFRAPAHTPGVRVMNNRCWEPPLPSGSRARFGVR